MVLQKKDKGQIRVGVCVLLWAMWNVRDDFTFNKNVFHHFWRLSFCSRIGSRKINSLLHSTRVIRCIYGKDVMAQPRVAGVFAGMM
jgi:hypothetical protein